MNARIDELIPLVSMLSRRDILKYVEKKIKKGEPPWETDKISNTQIDSYIRKAKDAMKKSWETARKEAVERSYNNVGNLYKKAFQDGDWKTCLAMQEKIDKLAGIDKAKETVQETSITFGVTTDMIKSLIKNQNEKD